MKSFYTCIALLLMLLIIPSCSIKKDVPLRSTGSQVTPAKEPAKEIQGESHKPVVKQDIKLVAKKDVAEYIFENALTLGNIERLINTPNGDIKSYIVQVKGLRNKVLEDRLNKAIMDDVTSYLKDYAKNDQDFSKYTFTDTSLNVNNLLSISISKNDYQISDGLLYRITDCRRFYLEDIFTEGTDYVSLLNRKVIEKIIGGNEEEDYILREPFSTISPDQSFLLERDSLNILFHKGDAGFIRDYSVKIPLYEINDYIDIIDTQSPDKNIFEKPYNTIEYNNIFKKDIQKNIDTPNGKVFLIYPEYVGMKNPAMEKRLNSFIQELVNETMNSDYMKELKVDSPLEHFGSINIYPTFNNYGYLSITRSGYLEHPTFSYGDFFKSIIIDLKDGNIISPTDMIETYANKHYGFKADYAQAVRTSFMEQHGQLDTDWLEKTYTYDYIMLNSQIYFQCNPYSPPSIEMNFMPTPQDTTLYWASLSFYDDLNISPEEFFER